MPLFPYAQDSYQMQIIKTRIQDLSNVGTTLEEFIQSQISEWKNSEKYKAMLKADAYYASKNDICTRKRYTVDKTGQKIEAVNMPNNKLAHGFLRKLVDQKASYSFSKPFSIKAEPKTYADHLTEVYNDRMRAKVKHIGKEAIRKGLAWVKVYYDERTNVLSYKSLKSHEVIPFWDDDEHTELCGIIYFYEIEVYEGGGKKKIVTRVEYCDEKGYRYFKYGDDGKLTADTDVNGNGQMAHFYVDVPAYTETGEPVLTTEGNPVSIQEGRLWAKIPFICFKYSDDETGLLELTKPLIDDYDLTRSDVSNNIADVPYAIRVIVNYDGQDLGEFVHNLTTYRTVKIKQGGDLKLLHQGMDIATVEAHVERTRKDIYEFGRGVDNQSEVATNASGAALDRAYNDIDLDATDIESNFKFALADLTYFINADAKARGIGDFTDPRINKLKITFNRDLPVNEEGVINACRNSKGVISDKTIIDNHPWTEDVEAEITQMEKEQKEAMELMGGGDVFGFGNPQGGKPQDEQGGGQPKKEEDEE